MLHSFTLVGDCAEHLEVIGMSTKTTQRIRKLNKEEERLVGQIVGAGIATKRHAERIIETRQHAVIRAWVAQLAAQPVTPEVQA